MDDGTRRVLSQLVGVCGALARSLSGDRDLRISLQTSCGDELIREPQAEPLCCRSEEEQGSRQNQAGQAAQR